MNTKPLLAIILVATAWLTSCSKDDDNNLPGFPMVSTITIGDSTSPFILELGYDSDNRLVSYSLDDTLLISYTYGTGIVTRKGYVEPGQVWIEEIYTLNSQGQAVSSITISNWKGNSRPSFPVFGGINGDSTYTTYEYDVNGYMTRKVMVDGGSDPITISYTILNGNVVEETETGGSWTYTSSYDYFLDKTNTIGNENYGIYFLGKQNKSLVRNISGSSFQESFTYEFDGTGRVSRQTPLTGQSYSFKYR